MPHPSTQRDIVLGITTTFLFNSVWENLHVYLYQSYINTWQYLPMWVVVSFGDCIIVAGIYTTLALFFEDWFWYRTPTVKKLSALVTSSVLIAVFIEKWWITLGRWAYSARMPIIPLVHVGLTPILQMVLIPLAVLGVLAIFKKDSQ